MNKLEKNKQFDAIAEGFIATGRRKNSYYYRLMGRIFSYFVAGDSSVLEVGCGWGDLLKYVRPKKGVGIDCNAKMVEAAKKTNPGFEYINADAQEHVYNEKFDFIIMADLLSSAEDIWKIFRNIKSACKPETRIIISQYNYFWMPVLRLAEKLGLKQPGIHDHWLSIKDIETFMRLNGFELISEDKKIFIPVYVPVVSSVVNAYISSLPIIRSLALIQMVVARPVAELAHEGKSVSVIIPTRNERENIKGAVERTPMLGTATELIFVDGSSTDGTVEEIEKYIEEYRGVRDISLIHQVGKGDVDSSGKMLRLGKGDAVRKGFNAAKYDVLMILDSDLTVPPEDLEKFYLAIIEDRCDFANGSRLVYQMETNAMRTLNVFGNYFFAQVFTYLIGQNVKDTLCGTKCLSKDAYAKIVDNRGFFGDFDPFGDFDLLFGASKLNLKIMDVPIRYRERVYGDVKIQRFKHGMILLKMSIYAFFKMRVKCLKD